MVGLRADSDKNMLLRASKRLSGTDHDKVSIVPDLTQRQRDQDTKLREEAKRMNREELTPDDIQKNLKWVAVGRKGARRLVKLPSKETSSHPHKDSQQKGKKRQREEARTKKAQKKKTKRAEPETSGALTNQEEEMETESEESEESEEEVIQAEDRTEASQPKTA